jgi:hypothetical protein
MDWPTARGTGAWMFFVSAAAGAALALVMPDRWSNLAETPWFAAWIVGPAFLVYAALSLVTLTDFVSNDGADPRWLAALWMISVALVTGGWALGLSALARAARRAWKRSGPSE